LTGGRGLGQYLREPTAGGISAIYDNAGQIAGQQIDWPAVRE